MNGLHDLHDRYPDLSTAEVDLLVRLRHFQRKANANHSSARATAIAPDCRPGDRPQDFPGN
jgi:hypothetical protein